MFRPSRVLRLFSSGLLALALITAPVLADGDDPPDTLKLVFADDGAQIMFDSAQPHCDENDMPDVNARAFRDAAGNIVMFALYDTNRALRGGDFAHLTLDCHVTLASRFDPDPAHHDDRNFITATWTEDGRDIVALVHQEYHADQHGRCRVASDLGCWYNTVLAYRSSDAGANFAPSQPWVVAAPPFKQEVEQGRHRGFFNPSNIFSDGTYEYFFAATTGWNGQPYGACLFRSATPENSASWRAFDGQSFSIRYDDPYRAPFTEPRPCAPISPFTFPVGAVVRERASGRWIAVFQASHNADVFPVDGFYYAEAKDLTHWSEPHLLLAGKTLYSDPCAATSLIAYPSLIDPSSPGRNFDTIGSAPYLYYAMIDVDKCATGARRLVRRRLSVLSAADAQP